MAGSCRRWRCNTVVCKREVEILLETGEEFSDFLWGGRGRRRRRRWSFLADFALVLRMSGWKPVTRPKPKSGPSAFLFAKVLSFRLEAVLSLCITIPMAGAGFPGALRSVQ